MREFMDFLKMHDPGLKEEKNGDFAGLQRISDPEDGTALWTTLADQKDIEDALNVNERTRSRQGRGAPATSNKSSVRSPSSNDDRGSASESKEKAKDAGTGAREMDVEGEEGGTKTNAMDSSGEIQEFIKAAVIAARSMKHLKPSFQMQ